MTRAGEAGASRAAVAATSRRWPVTLVAGAALILVVELLLALDVRWRGGVIMPSQEMPAPVGAAEIIARWAAMNVTPLCWLGYLLATDGVLTLLARRRGAADAERDAVLGSPARRRLWRFVLCFLASVPIWLYFDWINFTFLDAWRYHGLPRSMSQRWTGYFVAFGAICPGMFMTAELLQQLGLRRLRGRGLHLGPPHMIVIFLLGIVFTALPIILRDPIANLMLWPAPILLLDPVNRWLGAPSLLADWRAGRAGRTVSLMAGGLICGLLWEFWNYWAIAKWTYNLPFLGPLENVRYFEMPVLGLLGFIPFGPACWVMWQTIGVGLRRVGVMRDGTLEEDAIV